MVLIESHVGHKNTSPRVSVPRKPDGGIDVFKLRMRDRDRVAYGAYTATPEELAEMVMAVVEAQKLMREIRAGVPS